MRAKLCGFLVLALTALALIVPQPAVATHHWSRLMLSRDGHHWKPDLNRSLFGRKYVMVPGAKANRTFYVKNQSGRAARLAVTVRVKGSAGMIENRDFRLKVRTARHRWQPVRHSGRHKVAHLRMAKGRMVPVTVQVRMLPRAGSVAMDGHLRFVTQVRLTRKG